MVYLEYVNHLKDSPMPPRSKPSAENIYELAHGTREQQMAAARWPDCPSDLVAHLFQSREYDVREAVANHPNMPEDFIRSIFDRTISQKPLPVPELIKNPPGGMRPDWSKWGPDGMSSSVLGAISREQYISQWQGRMSSLNHEMYSRDIVFNPNFPVDLMESYLVTEPEKYTFAGEQHIYGYIRDDLVQHPNMSPELMWKVFEKYSSDTKYDVLVRAQLAKNPSLPDDLVKRLLVDPAWEVHRSLALNKGLDSKLLWPLLISREVKVLNPLSKRYSGDEQELVLDRLASISKSRVAQRAVASRTSNPDKIMAAVLGGDPEAREAVLNNPNLTEEAKIAYQLLRS